MEKRNPGTIENAVIDPPDRNPYFLIIALWVLFCLAYVMPSFMMRQLACNLLGLLWLLGLVLAITSRDHLFKTLFQASFLAMMWIAMYSAPDNYDPAGGIFCILFMIVAFTTMISASNYRSEKRWQVHRQNNYWPMKNYRYSSDSLGSVPYGHVSQESCGIPCPQCKMYSEQNDVMCRFCGGQLKK